MSCLQLKAVRVWGVRGGKKEGEGGGGRGRGEGRSLRSRRGISFCFFLSFPFFSCSICLVFSFSPLSSTLSTQPNSENPRSRFFFFVVSQHCRRGLEKFDRKTREIRHQPPPNFVTKPVVDSFQVPALLPFFSFPHPLDPKSPD